MFSSSQLCHSGRFWEGTEKPSWSLTLAAHAAPFLPAPSDQLCGGSAHHHPSLGGGDIGHACILSPLAHPKETGESPKSRSVSCDPVVFPVMLHSAAASKANTGDVQTGQISIRVSDRTPGASHPSEWSHPIPMTTWWLLRLGATSGQV